MSHLKYMNEVEESCKENVLSNVSFDFCYFWVKKWLYIIPVSLDFENNTSEDEILRRLCVVRELHSLDYLMKDESSLKTKIHIFPIFYVKFRNFTELWKH